jgi:hypothetical protein
MLFLGHVRVVALKPLEPWEVAPPVLGRVYRLCRPGLCNRAEVSVCGDNFDSVILALGVVDCLGDPIVGAYTSLAGLRIAAGCNHHLVQTI